MNDFGQSGKVIYHGCGWRGGVLLITVPRVGRVGNSKVSAHLEWQKSHLARRSDSLRVFFFFKQPPLRLGLTLQ